MSKTESDLLFHSNRQRVFNSRLRRAVIAGLFVLSIASATMALLALNSSAEADRQRFKIGDLTAFLIGEFADNLDTTGNLTLIQKIADRTLEYCLDIQIESASANELITCSRASRKKGEILLDQSKHKDAKAHFDRSSALSAKALSIEPDAKSSLNEAGQSASWLGLFYERTGDLEGAITEWERYLRFTDDLVSRHTNDPESHMQKSYALTNLGYAELQLGHYQTAFDYLSESKSIKREALDSQKKRNPEHEFELAVTSSLICNVHTKMNRPGDASECYAAQISDIERLLANNEQANDWKRQLANLMQWRAAVELDLGRDESAQELIEESIKHLTYLNETEPNNHKWATYLARAHKLASDIASTRKSKPMCFKHIDAAIKKMAEYSHLIAASGLMKDDLIAKRSKCKKL